MKFKLLADFNSGADIIVLLLLRVMFTFVFKSFKYWSWHFRTDTGTNSVWFTLPTFSVIIDWDRTHEI
jgi:hypothetical protein